MKLRHLSVKKLITYIFAFLLFLAAPALASENARIDDVTVARNPLTVSFVVKGAFTKDIEEAVKSGIPTAFNFIVELERVSVWFDEAIFIREFKHTVRYDSLKEEYEVTLDETNEKVRVKDFGEMKALMTSVTLPFNGTAELVPGADYEIRAMAELDPVELPALLNYMLFFVKFWDFETDWYVYRLTP